jgi:hypothetical protein
MTSNINYAAISTTYPVAGQDNDSQGFRDNFTAISAGLATAKTEISALQTNALLAVDLATSSNPVVNNMLGSTLSNGLYLQFNGVFFNGGTVATSAAINLNNGPIQQFTASGNITLTFNNWPTSGKYAVVRVMLIGDQQTTRTVTLSTSNAGLIKPATGWANGSSLPATVTLGTTGKYEMIEAWTVNAGATVFLKAIGEY